jgi:hypothetical protein
MHENFKIMELTRKDFSPYCDLIYNIYKTKGSFFDEEEKFRETFYIAASGSISFLQTFIDCPNSVLLKETLYVSSK